MNNKNYLSLLKLFSFSLFVFAIPVKADIVYTTYGYQECSGELYCEMFVGFPHPAARGLISGNVSAPPASDVRIQNRNPFDGYSSNNVCIRLVSDSSVLCYPIYDAGYVEFGEAYAASDMDGDLIIDLYDRCKLVYDPNQDGQCNPNDQDNDDMPDSWEISYGLNQYSAADANQDLDGDGYTNLEEYVGGLDPTVVNPAPTSKTDFGFASASDLFFHNSGSGETKLWEIENFVRGSVVDSPEVLPSPWLAVGAGDFSSYGDNDSDILFYNPLTGEVKIYRMEDYSFVVLRTGDTMGNLDYQIVGIGDFNSDRVDDILWMNQSNRVLQIWEMRGSHYYYDKHFPGTQSNPDWEFQGVADFNGDSTADILWQKTTGNRNLQIWEFDNFAVQNKLWPGALPNANITIEEIGDFDGNGNDDILWRNNTGNNLIQIWEMNNFVRDAKHFPSSMPNAAIEVKSVGDYDWNGTEDILWQNTTTGLVQIWEMDNFTRAAKHFPGTQNTDYNLIQ